MRSVEFAHIVQIMVSAQCSRYELYVFLCLLILILLLTHAVVL